MHYDPWTTFKSEPHFSAQCSCGADNSSLLDVLSSLGIYVCINREQQFWLAIPGLCDHFKHKLSSDLSSVFPHNKLPACIGLLTYRFPKGKGGGWLNKAFSIIRVCRRLWTEIAIPGQCSKDFYGSIYNCIYAKQEVWGMLDTLNCVIKRWMCLIYDRNCMPRADENSVFFWEFITGDGFRAL